MDRTDVSLLERLQGLIERTYDLETGVRDIGRYVIGDMGYRRLYGALPPAVMTERVLSATTGARTLIRQGPDGLMVSLYYPDHLIECLEDHDPLRRLDDQNVDAFSVLVEELDHFLVIAERYRHSGVLSLLDLELHANVTKYLVLKMFVGKMRGVTRLSEADNIWIRFHLFNKGDFVDPDPLVRTRYNDAARIASRYVRRLDQLPPSDRPRELRRFHRMTPQSKIAHVAAFC